MGLGGAGERKNIAEVVDGADGGRRCGRAVAILQGGIL